jgi:hypothetical protein
MSRTDRPTSSRRRHVLQGLGLAALLVASGAAAAASTAVEKDELKLGFM